MNNKLVPWFDRAEWLTVYNGIYSAKTVTDKRQALKLLLVWKARSPFLPAGIDSTLSLLQVNMRDLDGNSENNHNDLIRLAYSTAIMRFVNHMLDFEQAKGATLYKAAERLGIPDWIVDLRHDTAHNNSLPSIKLLREATLIALDWLHQSYWKKHEELISDFVISEEKIGDVNKVAILIRHCISLSICLQSRRKLRRLSDIPDDDLREALIAEAKELFNEINPSEIYSKSILYLVNLIKLHFKKIPTTDNVTAAISATILEKDSLFLSLELVQMLSHKEFYVKDSLSESYVKCFEVLLTFLHTRNSIMDLIFKLVAMTISSMDHDTSKLAALWTREILKALYKSKLYVDRMNRLDIQPSNSKTKQDLIKLFCHWFPNMKKPGLYLDLQKTIPSELFSLNVIQSIISEYNPYLVYFVKDLVKFLDPPLPEEDVKTICTLSNLISGKDLEQSVFDEKIYTLEDLEMDCLENTEHNEDVTGVIEVDQQTETLEAGIWSKASSTFKWSSCPIGLLPWQQNVALESDCIDISVN